ncbi:MAG: PDZ domain-containing protein [Anaerolineales bacterium]|nr:PDZ domain-containing protein [Anaerolineales bacterium]
MSDKQKQTVTIVLIAILAVLLCGGLVMGAVALFGGVRTAVPAPLPTTISPSDGVLIQTVFPASPAAAANLQPGHVILRLNDDPVTSPEMLTLLLQNVPAEEAFTLLVRDAAGDVWQTTAVRAAAPPFLGVEVVDLPLRTPQAATTTNPPVTTLPTVSGVVPGSPAELADVRVGDVITAVDNQAILNGDELLDQMAQKAPGNTVTLMLRRGEETLLKTAVLAPNPDDATRGYLGIEFRP